MNTLPIKKVDQLDKWWYGMCHEELLSFHIFSELNLKPFLPDSGVEGGSGMRLVHPLPQKPSEVLDLLEVNQISEAHAAMV